MRPRDSDVTHASWSHDSNNMADVFKFHSHPYKNKNKGLLLFHMQATFYKLKWLRATRVIQY